MRPQLVKLGRTKFFIVISEELTQKAITLIVNGFSKEVLKLPMEFAVEAQKY